MRTAASRTGPAIVLTADRTLMAHYATLLDGMSAASQTTWLPSRLMHRWVAPAVPIDRDRRATVAPLGLRRLEAALMAHGFERHEVAIVPPEHLGRAITSRTRVIGVSSGDPLGIGMNSTTVAALFGGDPITSYACRKLLRRINHIRAAHSPNARLLLGGPGAWQFHEQSAALVEYGIDHLVTGYAESSFPVHVEELMSGHGLPPILRGRGLPAGELPPIVGPTVMGMVELSRGCGWGCHYCTLSQEPMGHVRPETVLADVATNLAGGVCNIALGSEDFFRYGGQGGNVAPGAIIDLLSAVRQLDHVRTLSVDHANIASIAAIDDAALDEIARLLRGGESGPRPWLNLGVETASGRLLAEQGGRRKLQPFGAEGWAEACLAQIRRLVDHGYFPLVSLVINLPGETPDDVAATASWIEQLGDLPLAVVPLMLAPLTEADGDCRQPVGGADGTASKQPSSADLVQQIRRDQWALLGQGMELTFRHMPGLYFEHHRAAGVSMFRRSALQVMGWSYTRLWRGRLGRCRRRAEKP